MCASAGVLLLKISAVNGGKQKAPEECLNPGPNTQTSESAFSNTEMLLLILAECAHYFSSGTTAMKHKVVW